MKNKKLMRAIAAMTMAAAMAGSVFVYTGCNAGDGDGGGGSNPPITNPQNYDITFNANGGKWGSDETKKVTTDDEGKVNVPANPTRADEPPYKFNFKGWGESPEATKTEDVASLTFSAAKTYYAVWEKALDSDKYDTISNTIDFQALQEQYGTGGMSEDVTVGAVTFKGNGKLKFDTSSSKYCVNEQQAGIILNLSGVLNSVSFQAKSGSSNKSTNIYLYSGESASGTVVKDFGQAPGEFATYSAENLAAGKYLLTGLNAAVRFTALTYTQIVEKSAPKSMVLKLASTDLLLGREVSKSGINAEVTYDNGNSRTVTLAPQNIDTSEININETGEYKLKATYSEEIGEPINAEITVNVRAVTGISIGTTITNGNKQTTFKTLYLTGSTFSTAGLSVIGKTGINDAKGNEITFKLAEGEYSATAPTLTTAGTQTYTISAPAKITGAGEIAGEPINIYVVDKGTVSGDSVTVAVNPAEEVSNASFKTITDALSYFEQCKFDANVKKIINIADGTYKEKVFVDVPGIELVGSEGEISHASDNKVVIEFDAIAGVTDNSGAGYGTNGSATVSVSSNAKGFKATNITFKNYYNTKALYDQSLNISTNSQAVALLVESDSAQFFNCKLTSYHDTLYSNKGKHYYENCFIEGHTDFIFGQDATAYFNGCKIYSLGAGVSETNGGYVTALKPSNNDNTSYAFIYNNCDFSADENTKAGSVALGRAWGAGMKMVVMNSQISAAYSTAPHTKGTGNGQRYCTMSGNEPKPANMLEYNNRGDGKITATIENTCTYMTATDAANYDLGKLETLLGFMPDSEALLNEFATITVHVYDTADEFSVNVKKGEQLTAQTIQEALVNALDGKYAIYEVEGVYTDSDCNVQYTAPTVTGDGAVYIKVNIGDLTVTEDASWNFKSDVGGVEENQTKYYGKLKVETGAGSSFKDNGGGWYQAQNDVKLTLKINAGTKISVNVYNPDTVKITSNGTEKEVQQSGVQGSVTVVYEATEAGEVVTISLKDGASSALYIGSISVDVKKVFEEDAVIDFTQFTETWEGKTGKFQGALIDATNGKIRANGNSVQINAGTTIKLYVKEGATVTLNYYSGFEGQMTVGTYDASDGSITITVNEGQNPYLVSISITFAA